MKTVLFGIFIVFGLFFGQDVINYEHKSIFNALRKVTGATSPQLVALKLLHSSESEEKIQGKFFKIVETNNVKSRYYLYIGRVNSCRAGGCSSSSGQPIENPEYEYFDYFILFDNAATVRLVKVFNYEATHGQEITAPGWLKQFSGYSASKYLKVGKNIDAISGATVSVYAITLDVQDKTRLLREILLQQQLTNTKMPI